MASSASSALRIAFNGISERAVIGEDASTDDVIGVARRLHSLEGKVVRLVVKGVSVQPGLPLPRAARPCARLVRYTRIIIILVAS